MSFKKRVFLFLLPLIRFSFGIFYKKEYLTGKYFSNSLIGWRWALRSIVWQKIFGFNRHVPWPVSPFIKINDPNKIHFHIDDINNFQTYGNYFQNFNAEIYIGKGTYIAPNVGIITVNHNIKDLDTYQDGEDIIIGERCWIGMNSMILPGVELGNNTIVGAGSIVTKSFTEGNLIVAGNPARIVKRL
ncbi:MAG: capsular polysaccharide synthesis enzyme [Clostridia bacterium]|jgi:acetyltransferase-like isoleucine patch superfamily enzyme|nr:capsular polysaccharide synthesis enzyme [Clostridia bacterium]